jgi:putative transposase
MQRKIRALRRPTVTLHAPLAFGGAKWIALDYAQYHASASSAGKRKLIIDRDASYCADFRNLLANAGCDIRLPPRSPNLNAYAERFVGSIKSECLNRLIFFGEASLRRAIRRYMAHCQEEHNHQGVNNRLLKVAANDASYRGCVVQDSIHRG